MPRGVHRSARREKPRETCRRGQRRVSFGELRRIDDSWDQRHIGWVVDLMKHVKEMLHTVGTTSRGCEQDLRCRTGRPRRWVECAQAAASGGAQNARMISHRNALPSSIRPQCSARYSRSRQSGARSGSGRLRGPVVLTELASLLRARRRRSRPRVCLLDGGLRRGVGDTQRHARSGRKRTMAPLIQRGPRSTSDLVDHQIGAVRPERFELPTF
jgi:hypothetical protein